MGIDKWSVMKGNMLGYFKYIDDIDKTVEDFWEINEHKIKNWYRKRNHLNDVIISASPEFLLEPICKKFNVKKLIGTVVDKNTGKLIGNNCYGHQKENRLKQEINDYHILEFYSDSLSDTPLANMADKSYIVIGDRVIDWNDYKLPILKKFKQIFLSREFILFIFIGVINTMNSVVFSILFVYWILDAILAFYCGYVLSNIIAYILNNVIIFKQKLSVKKYFKFFVSYIPNFIIQNIIIFIICNLLYLNSNIAYLTAAVIGLPITFLFVKLFAFKKEKKFDIMDLYEYREF